MSKLTNEELMARFWEDKPYPKSDDARLGHLIRAYYANQLVAKIEAERAAEADLRNTKPVSASLMKLHDDTVQILKDWVEGSPLSSQIRGTET